MVSLFTCVIVIFSCTRIRRVKFAYYASLETYIVNILLINKKTRIFNTWSFVSLLIYKGERGNGNSYSHILTCRSHIVKKKNRRKYSLLTRKSFRVASTRFRWGEYQSASTPTLVCVRSPRSDASFHNLQQFSKIFNGTIKILLYSVVIE